MPKLYCIFSPVDNWCPMSYVNHLKQRFPTLQHEITDKSIPHAFVVGASEEVGVKVVERWNAWNGNQTFSTPASDPVYTSDLDFFARTTVPESLRSNITSTANSSRTSSRRTTTSSSTSNRSRSRSRSKRT